MPFDVFFYEAFAEEAEQLKELLPQDIKAGFTPETIQESGDQTPPARLISIRTQSIIPPEWAGKLDAVLSRSTGYDHLIRFQQETHFSGALGYLPRYCHRAVAEQAMLLWMALLRKLPQQQKQFLTFKRDGLTGGECAGKTLLVVGVGNVGYQVVNIGKGLQMHVWGVDIVKRHEDVDYVDIEQGIVAADVVVSAMNLTEQNRGYFNYSLLRQGKPEKIFINVARGELSPLADLYRLLKEGYLGGLALDVYEQEQEIGVFLRQKDRAKPPEVLRWIGLLRLMPNVILTPHNAFNTMEAVQRKSEHSILQIVEFLKNKNFIWPVPIESCC